MGIASTTVSRSHKRVASWLFSSECLQGLHKSAFEFLCASALKQYSSIHGEVAV